jgi:hypothetical protein
LSTSGSSRQPSRILLITLLVLVTIAVNLVAMDGYRQRNMQSFLAAFADKQELLQSTPSPRVILVGGSSVAFGFDCAALAQKVGVPVVNMGLQGGLGLPFELESLKPDLREGDIVILSPEYHNILGKLNGGEMLAQIAVLYPRSIQYFSTWNEVWQMMRTFPAVHASAIRNMLEDLKLHHCLVCTNREPVYYRDAFDKSTGDVVINEAITRRDAPIVLNLPFDIDSKELSESIKILNRFVQYAAARNITVFFYYPSSVDVTDVSTAEILKQLDRRLRVELTIPILNSLKDSQYGSEYMYDTAYHLNWAGDALNTQRLGELLCRQDVQLNCK